MASFKPKFLGVIDSNGELHIDKQSYVGYHQHLLNLKGLPVTIVIDKVRKTRSDRQNAYYHGVVCKIIADFTGHSSSEIHTAVSMKFLSMTDSKGITFTRSTTDLNTIEMENYLDRIRIWARTELGVFVPMPNQVDY